MADDVVWLPDHLLLGEAADVREGLVGLHDDALQVGLGVDELVFGQEGFDVGDWLVVAHGALLLILGLSGPLAAALPAGDRQGRS